MDIIIKVLEEEVRKCFFFFDNYYIFNNQLGDKIYQPPTKLLENNEPDSADIIAFASSAEQTSVSLFELYLSLNELSKYKIYVNETYV